MRVSSPTIAHALGMAVALLAFGATPTAVNAAIAEDSTPPVVVSATPANNATGVKRGTTVTVTFDEALDAASITNSSLTLACEGTSISGAVTATATGLVFTPAAPLPTYRLCTATIPANGVRDLAQNGNVGSTSWSFRTAMVRRSLTVARDGTGSGRVLGAGMIPPPSTNYSIDCGNKCTADVLAGNTFMLDAIAAPGSTFVKWTGCPQPAGNRCVIPAMSRDRTVTARFNAAGASNTIPATVDFGLTGTRTLVFHKAPNVSQSLPYADGSSYVINVSTGGVLMVAGVPYTDPYHRVINGTTIETEVNWRTSYPWEFAMSDNVQRLFNEINLYSTTEFVNGYGKWLGQFSNRTGTVPDLSPLMTQTGNYTFKVTQKGGTLQDVPSQFALGDDVTFNIAPNGVITSNRLNRAFNPTGDGNRFLNNSVSIEPNLELLHTDNRGTTDYNDDITWTFRLYIQGGVVVGAKYSESRPCGFSSGCWTEASIMLERRPIASLHQTFINNLVAANPQNVTVIERNLAYAFLPAVCTEVPVAVTTGAQPYSAPVTFTINSYPQTWEARYARVADAPVTGNPQMRFMLMSVELMAGGKIRVTEHSGNNIAAIATNDPALISAAGCGSTGGSNQLRMSITGVLDVPGLFSQPISDTQDSTGDVSQIDADTVRASVLNDSPDAASLVVTPMVDTATHKTFEVTYTRPFPVGGQSLTASYTMFYDFLQL